jgi:hypothetical protein
MMQSGRIIADREGAYQEYQQLSYGQLAGNTSHLRILTVH